MNPLNAARISPLVLGSLLYAASSPGQPLPSAPAASADNAPLQGEKEPGREAPPSLLESLSGPARHAYESARILLNNRDWAGAMAKFEEAYDLSKDPRLLFNMALCARDLKQYVRMRELLLRYEGEAGSSLTPEARADVDAALAAVADLVGSVSFTVNELDAQVAIDGEPVGRSPLTAPIFVNLGRHTAQVTKSGFKPVEQPFEATGGKQTSLKITLVPEVRVGRLSVIADSGVTIRVDGQPVAVGRFDGALPAGAHRIRATMEGRKPYDATIQVDSGETRTLHLTLAADKPSRPLWPWIVGGVAVAAGIAVGGYFLFRPDSRESEGPTGSLDTVDLALHWGGP